MLKTLDCATIIRSFNAEGFVRTNASFVEKVGFPSDELVKKPFLNWVAIEDQSLVNDLLSGKLESCRVHHITKNGDYIELFTRISFEEDGGHIILARFVDDKGDKPNNNFQHTEIKGNVKSTLHEIALIVEEENPEFKCSILLVEDGHFVKGAGPSLPDDYNNAIDGFAIGPTVGSCGTAIYWNVPVIVNDIQNDPLWEPFAELAKNAGVYACWSHPFTSKSGRVLGALAFYSPAPRTPSGDILHRLKAAAQMTGLAVERGRAEEELIEKHRVAQELEEQLRQAAKLEALGVLAGGIAHDFNNILATILINTELSLKAIKQDSINEGKGIVEDSLQDVVTACRRAGNLCNQMLSYAGRAKVEKKEVAINHLISELNSLVKASLSKKTTLEFSLGECPYYVNGDENQLLQVIMNLVTNAAEAMRATEGSIVLSSGVKDYNTDSLRKISPEDELPAGTYVYISVKDSGSGMNDEVKARIFDPFYTTKSTGRGLGLSAVKGIIKMYRGTILLESEESVGTTFTVLLPLKRTGTSTIVAEKSNSEEKDATTPTCWRILYADDEDLVRKSLSKFLAFDGHEVVPAQNGQEAVDIFKKSHKEFDCVILDLSMPKLNGREAAVEINKIDKNIPIFIMSGYTGKEISSGLEESIISGTLQKPIDLETLTKTLEKSIKPDRNFLSRQPAYDRPEDASYTWRA